MQKQDERTVKETWNLPLNNRCRHLPFDTLGQCKKPRAPPESDLGYSACKRLQQVPQMPSLQSQFEPQLAFLNFIKNRMSVFDLQILPAEAIGG